MNDFSKIFEQMMEQGQKMVRDFNPDLADFQAMGFDGTMPKMPKDMMDMFWGKSLNPDGLDAKTRLLIMLAGMTVQGAPVEAMFKSTVSHALEAGATEQEIAEVITQMSVLGGLPAMTRALEFVRSTFTGNDGEPA